MNRYEIINKLDLAEPNLNKIKNIGNIVYITEYR